MDIPIYERLKDFKESYILDFTNSGETNFYQHLKNVSNKYIEYVRAEIDKDNKYHDELMNVQFSVLKQLELLIPPDAYLILFHDLWADYCNEDEIVIFENPDLFCDIIDFDWTAESKSLIHRFFEIEQTRKGWQLEQNEFTSRYLKILRFIEDEKKEIEKQLKQPQIFQNDIDLFRQTQINEPEPLTQKGIEKIGLFVRSGIINFLKEKNPNITKTQLSKFLRELTSEYLENSESTRPHLTTNTNSEKHPFYANGRLNELDLILKKYGIEPQADN